MKHPYSQFAETVEIDGIYYNLVTKAKQAEVTINPNKYSGTVKIPETISYNDVTYSISSIGHYAFCGCRALTSVTIPNSVTNIGNDAFCGCSGLIFVNIPNSVTSIGAYAFCRCRGLTSVTIPNSVISIGEFAFTACLGLTSVTIPNSVTSIGAYAFRDCSSLTSVTIPDSVISIGEFAFTACLGLTFVNIPNSVTSIGDGAFYNCSSLTSVAIPNSVTSIGEHAFDGCTSLKKVIVPDIAAWCGIDFANDDANPLCYAKHLYSDETTEITNLIIPNSVTSIGDWAFCGCDGLTSVTIPNSVITIGDWAFHWCTGLTSVNIGNGVKSIGKDFAYCKELTDVYCYADKIPSAEAEAFSYSNIWNATLHVPAASIEQYKTATPWINFGTIVPLTDEDAIAEVQAVPVLIQTQGNTITVEGAEAGTEIILYGANGVQLDSVVATTGVASLSTSRLSGSVAIIKIGNKTVKVLMKQ